MKRRRAKSTTTRRTPRAAKTSRNNICTNERRVEAGTTRSNGPFSATKAMCFFRSSCGENGLERRIWANRWAFSLYLKVFVAEVVPTLVLPKRFSKLLEAFLHRTDPLSSRTPPTRGWRAFGHSEVGPRISLQYSIKKTYLWQQPESLRPPSRRRFPFPHGL